MPDSPERQGETMAPDGLSSLVGLCAASLAIALSLPPTASADTPDLDDDARMNFPDVPSVVMNMGTISTMRTGHHRLADGSLLRVDIERGSWVGSLYTRDMRVKTRVVGSDVEVHAWAGRVAR
jgi:hypothetical protein